MPLSLNPHEAEVLIAPGARLRITRIELCWRNPLLGEVRRDVTNPAAEFPMHDPEGANRKAWNDTRNKYWVVSLTMLPREDDDTSFSGG